MVKNNEQSRKEAQETAINLIRLVEATPGLKSDVVLQALIHKLCEMVVKDFGSDQSFKTVGIAMNALRGAGVFAPSGNSPNADSGNLGNARPEPKSKARSTQAEVPQKATEKGQKMRGLDRGIDMLLEFGYLTQEDVNAFRNLRKDPDLLIKFTKDGEELQRRVKDTGDWDLLYTMDKTMYDKWLGIANQMTADFKASKGAFEPESFFALMRAALEQDSNGDWSSSDHVGLRSVLKGPPLETAAKMLKKPGSMTIREFLDDLRNQVFTQRWYKFGKSPTLA